VPCRNRTASGLETLRYEVSVASMVLNL